MHRRRLVAVVGAGLLVLAIGGFVVATFTEPTIESIDNRWGETTEETAEIRTEVTVDNPNIVPIPSILTLEYDVRLNSVTVATGEKAGVGFPPGRSTVALSTRMDNSKIALWWRTHIQQNERTTLHVDPRVRVRWIGTTIDLPEQRNPVNTDIIDSLNREASQPVPLLSDREVILQGISSSWGEPTADRTPIKLTLNVENQLDERVSIDEVEYAILLNGVNVGGDGLDRKLTLAADGPTTVRLTVYIVNERMNEWWVTHLGNGEVTTVRIELSGTASVQGYDEQNQFTVPVQNSTIETDVLGG